MIKVGYNSEQQYSTGSVLFIIQIFIPVCVYTQAVIFCVAVDWLLGLVLSIEF